MKYWNNEILIFFLYLVGGYDLMFDIGTFRFQSIYDECCKLLKKKTVFPIFLNPNTSLFHNLIGNPLV